MTLKSIYRAHTQSRKLAASSTSTSQLGRPQTQASRRMWLNGTPSPSQWSGHQAAPISFRFGSFAPVRVSFAICWLRGLALPLSRPILLSLMSGCTPVTKSVLGPAVDRPLSPVDVTKVPFLAGLDQLAAANTPDASRFDERLQASSSSAVSAAVASSRSAKFPCHCRGGEPAGLRGRGSGRRPLVASP